MKSKITPERAELLGLMTDDVAYRKTEELKESIFLDIKKMILNIINKLPKGF